MSKVSRAQKLGVVARVAAQQAKRSRTMRAATQAAAATGRAFGRVLHQLWLEVTGVVFLVMALSLGAGSVREYGKYHAGQAGPGRTALAICCAVVFTGFGVSSFWRVKNKRKDGVR
jgi:hypothetical protein